MTVKLLRGSQVFCIISIILCFVNAGIIADIPIIADDVASKTWQQLCPSLANSKISNETYMKSDFKSQYSAAYSHSALCGNPGCAQDVVRIACSATARKGGLISVDVINRYPFLAYENQVSFEPKSVPRPVFDAPAPSRKTGPRLAYLLLVHDKFNQTMRLLESVYHPDHFYVFHVDAKNPELKKQISEYTSKIANVFVLETPFKMMWGQISLVYAMLQGIFGLLDLGKWDYIINLSSADYPLCSNEELVSYLGTKNGANFDEARATETSEEKHWRPRNILLWCDSPACSPMKGAGADWEVRDFEAFVGSQWFVYSRGFSEYIRKSDAARNLLLHYEYTWIADEGYLPTVLMNSPYKDTRIKNNLRYIDFPENADHPVLFTKSYLPDLEKAGDRCFARKFDAGVDIAIYNSVDAMRAAKTRKLFLP